ncbi:MAG: DUF4399 domain-containing protein [Geminicoccaceae bacterium]
MKRIIATAAVVLPLAGAALAQDRTVSPEGASAYFISPAAGDSVTSPVTVVFGLDGMGVAPAGTEKDSTGHHHLLINTGLPALDEPIPADDNHVHFGGGQTQVEIELAPGEHSLQLLLGDLNHIPHDPPITSEVITITVE